MSIRSPITRRCSRLEVPAPDARLDLSEGSMDDSQLVRLGEETVAGYAGKELLARVLGPGEMANSSADMSIPYQPFLLSKAFLAGKNAEGTRPQVRTGVKAPLPSSREQA
jgi:hypothetical protein